MPELLPLILSPDAAGELEAIYEPLFSEVIKRVELLCFYPELGQSMNKPFTGWRATVVGMYRIIYRITDLRIEIGYIRHCARRDPKP